jgi:hypothetical protein
VGFNKKYWKDNYSDPEEMDGIGNAKDHARYLKMMFDMELVDISSIIDFGYGMGYLFKAILKKFKPYLAHGIEPSKYMYDQIDLEYLRPVPSTELELENIDLKTWCEQNKRSPMVYDLGICTSVLQYIPDEDIPFVMKCLSRRVKFLYFSVPTDIELDRQVSELEFKDQYALRRTREQYRKWIKPYFTIISNRLLESKYYYSEQDSFFTDLFFRS